MPARVAALWAELLGHQEIAAAADFFELGGDSLLVTRLARRLSAELGVRVPIRELLLARTLDRQSEVVAALAAQAPAPAATEAEAG
ncbi:acyl carrier protein [Streptomyces bambusae]|uniref:acyl carrier protein n=1 Tax=Streptomyces bambusae TaxID=1550616 RepID=UPI0027DECDB4|nr:acyl carrier protein [Streptomyces bambusae]